jgi:uncharacterized protein YdeI (YjbR/CyaY-like superfamily)
MKNQQVDNYLIAGCGRCKLYNTPQCKVHRFTQELSLLREIILSTGLKEELKWGVPCYTFNSKNIILIGAFNDNCVISFLKGSLINDKYSLLQNSGENSHQDKVIRFSNLKQIEEIHEKLIYYINEAILIEKEGKKIKPFDSNTLVFPDLFIKKLNEDNALKTAFDSLTPGRKRSYHIFFTQAKQEKTLESRILKSIHNIINGKGLNE